MTKRKQTIIALIIAIVFLGAVAAALLLAEPADADRRGDGPFDDVSELAIVDTDRENIKSVTVNFGGEEYTAHRGEDGELTIDALDGAPRSDSNYELLETMAAKVIAADVYANKLTDDEKYGFSSPQSTVRIEFEDASDPVTVTLGNHADGAGYYAKADGVNKVYIMGDDFYQVFADSSLRYVSTRIIPPYTEENANVFKSITLSGTVREEPITVEMNPDADSAAHYTVNGAVALESKIELLYSPISSGLSAAYIEKLDPTDADIKNYGLDEPYSRVKYVYEDFTYDLKISRSDTGDDQLLYVMSDEYDIIYRVYAFMLPFYEWQSGDMA